MNWMSLNVRGVRGSAKKTWVQGIKKEFKVSFLAFQESQVEDVESIDFKGFWGKSQMEYEGVPSSGTSGGDCLNLGSVLVSPG